MIYSQSFGQRITFKSHLELGDGLSHRKIINVTRHSNGFFYILTNRSLQKWSGSEFFQMKGEQLRIKGPSQLNVLKDGNIILVEDRTKLRYINPKLDMISGVKTTIGSEYIASDSLIFEIRKDKIISYSDAQLNSIISNYPSTKDSIIDISYNGLDLYINTSSGIAFYSNNSWTPINLKGELIKNSDGRLFCISEKKVFELVKGIILPHLDLSGIDGDKLVLKKKDKHGNVLLGFGSKTDYISSLIIIEKTGQISKLNEVLKSNDNIIDLYSDNFKSNILLGTFNGLYSFKFASPFIKTYNVNTKISFSDFGKVVTGITRDNEDNLYFLHESSNLEKLNKTRDLVESINSKYHGSKISMGNKRILYHGRDHDLFIYTYKRNKGGCIRDLLRFDIKDSKYHEYDDFDFCINDFLWYGQDTLLIVGEDLDNKAAIGFFDINSESFTPIQLRQNKKSIWTISHDSKAQKYWLCTQSGLLSIDYDANTKKLNPKSIENHKRFDNSFVVTVVPYESYLAVGTTDGIYFYKYQDQTIEKRIDKKHGLAGDVVYSLIQDDNGFLWVGTENGLSVIDKSLEIKKNISVLDGLPSREFNTKACLKDAKGNLFFGTINGLVEIDPAIISSDTGTRTFELEKVHAYKKGALAFSKQANDNFFTITKDIDSVIIELKTIGYHNVRTEINNMDQIYITGSPGFTYEKINGNLALTNFEIDDFDLSLHSGYNQVKKTLRFERITNLEKYKYALFIGLLVALIAYLISKTIIDKFKKVESEKVELQKRINDLQLSALQSQMNPHFIFNALGSIQYFIQTHKHEKADKYLSDFASLMRSILESSKSLLITINDEIKTLRLYTGLEEVRFEDKMKVRFFIDDDLDMDFKIPPMIIQPFIENAINHGLYHLKNKKGLLNISFFQPTDDSIICEVKDNGIGREASSKYKSKSHKSRGMEIVNDRIKTSSKSQNLDIQIKLDDLYDNNIPSGTKVTITFDYI